jgi:flagellar FliL protein
MADEQQKPQQPVKKETAPGGPNIMVLIAVMVAGSFLASFLTVKFMAPSISAAAGSGAIDPGKVPDVAKGDKTKDALKPKTIFYKMGEFVVNLANKDNTRYLKTDITMEVVDAKEMEKTLKEKDSIFRDKIVEKLSSYTTQQLGSNEGRKAMKQELLESVTGADPEIKVVNIYFNSLMMQ